MEKMSKKTIIMVALLVIGFAGSVWWKWPDDKLRVVACDVGQGDGILVLKGFSQVVIDGGPEKGGIGSCLDRHIPFWDRKIEMVVMTHPQADHMDGLLSVVGGYRVLLWVAPSVAAENTAYKELLAKLRNEKTEMFVPKKGDVFRLGAIKFTVLWPEKTAGGKDWWNKAIKDGFNVSEYNQTAQNIADLNEISTVLSMTYGEFDALFTGDISAREELAIADSSLITDVDLLKVAHHGSKFSSSQAFLEEIRPEMALVSAGRKNSFGHPTSEVLMRLDAVGAKVLRTDLLGDVVVATDGEKVWVED